MPGTHQLTLILAPLLGLAIVVSAWNSRRKYRHWLAYVPLADEEKVGLADRAAVSAAKPLAEVQFLLWYQ